MKAFLPITCIFVALIMISVGGLSRAGETKLRLAGDCETNCRTNANACRAQCADPEEQEQCIVNCGKSECSADCDKFERSCNQHCQSSKG
jgi:hypothetical protein